MKSRRQHILKKQERTELPHFLAFIDTEAAINTDSHGVQTQTLSFGYCEIWEVRKWGTSRPVMREEFTFHDRLSFWSRLVAFPRDKTKLHVYCHNWQYDAAILGLDIFLEENNIKPTKLIADGGIFWVKFMLGDKSFSLVDSMNYFSTSLAKLGKSIGEYKLSMPSETDSQEQWIEYCKQDVGVLREAILKYLTFLHDNDLGNYQPTLAGQALAAFRHKLMSTIIYIHTNEEAIELEREGYYGGRVECWHIGTYTEKLYKVDINSMYPAMMRGNAMPTKLIRIMRDISLVQLVNILKSYLVMCKVTLTTQEPLYPYRDGQKLIFPIGEFTTVLSTPEIREAISRGHVKTVHTVTLYEGSNIFTDYVDFFYGSRMQYRGEGNSAFEYMCKIFLNSLYGKFGQRSGDWEEVMGIPKPPRGIFRWYHMEEGQTKPRLFRYLTGIVQEKKGTGEAYNAFPAIAAHTTGYARMFLWELMEKSGLNNLYYLDTDSLVINEAGYLNLTPYLDDKTLGMLKLEGHSYNSTFHGPKDYMFESDVHIKGVSAKAEMVSPGIYKQLQFTKWSSGAQKGISGKVIVSPVTKSLSRIYGKGVVHDNGEVTPIVLPRL